MTGPEPLRFRAGPGESPLRLDRWLAERIPHVSRSQIQSWIREGRVHVDGEPAPSRRLIVTGETVTVRVPAPRAASLEPDAGVPLRVVHEEEDFVVVDKPAGLQVHPGSGEARPTLVHGLLARYPDWAAPGPPERPGIVHRLDRSTSGLLVVARTPAAYLSLGRQIRERRATRRYLALVWGELPGDAGRIEAPIGRHARERTRMAVRRDGRPAATRWRTLARYEQLTLVEAQLETGRTHQIRVHFGHVGHPVFADPTYGRDLLWAERFAGPERALYLAAARRLNRQALHAYHLSFDRPADGRRVLCEAPIPKDFEEALLRIMERGVQG